MPSLQEFEAILAGSGATVHIERFKSRMPINGAIGRITVYGPNTSIKGEMSAYCTLYLSDGDTVSHHAIDGATSWASFARGAIAYWEEHT